MTTSHAQPNTDNDQLCFSETWIVPRSPVDVSIIVRSMWLIENVPCPSRCNVCLDSIQLKKCEFHYRGWAGCSGVDNREWKKGKRRKNRLATLESLTHRYSIENTKYISSCFRWLTAMNVSWLLSGSRNRRQTSPHGCTFSVTRQLGIFQISVFSLMTSD